MVNEELVKTDVDRLLALIKEKKEVSVEEAAKILNIPAKTVESLSDLLEEEGLLHIKYKFTTPYLTSEIPVKAAAKKKEAEEALVFEREEEKRKEAAEKEKAEMKPAEPSKISVKEVKEIKPEIKIAKPEKPLIPETDDIEELIKKANEFIAKGDFETARQIYFKVIKLKQELPKKFIQEERKVAEEVVDLNESIVKGIDEALSKDFNNKINEIENQFKIISPLVSQGRINSLRDLSIVEEAYKKIKDIYLSLPEGFIERKAEVQDRMLDTYRTILLSRKFLLS
ncbi:MAG: hypothetical protein N3D84_03175, partial [Candidatus Woesearchaeota archaeon]|nr:hypothetical protein [Candidatus Woesearchaeota archaeon]